MSTADMNNSMLSLEDGDLNSNTEAVFVPIEMAETSFSLSKTQIMACAIAQTTSSTFSLLATVTVIIMISRSYKKLSSVFHRLLLGLCIADILSSSSLSLSTYPIPAKESLTIWNAQGTIDTCTAQGFFIFVGFLAAQIYNCSLCIYYLFVIKYNKKDEYIRRHVEPFLHAVPIGTSLIGGIIIATKQAFNANKSFCWIGSDPPRCYDDNYNTGPCRGQDAKILYLTFATVPYIVLPIVILTSMGLMYLTARQNEKKMSGYGIHTLRLKSTVKSGDVVDGQERQDNSNRLLSKLKSLFQKSDQNLDASTSSRSNKLNKQSRAVLQKASAYSLAYFATYFFPLIITIRTSLQGNDAGFVLTMLSRIFFPLQGFFNFMVFIYPRMFSAKKENENVSWYRAFVCALQSRGVTPKGVGRKRGQQQSNKVKYSRL